MGCCYEKNDYKIKMGPQFEIAFFLLLFSLHALADAEKKRG